MNATIYPCYLSLKHRSLVALQKGAHKDQSVIDSTCVQDVRTSEKCFVCAWDGGPPEATLSHRRAPADGVTRQGPVGARGPHLTRLCARSVPCGFRDVAHHFLRHHHFRAPCLACALFTWMCLPHQYFACSGDQVSRGCDGSAAACLCPTSAFATATFLDLLRACAWTVGLAISVSSCLFSCSWFLR